MRSALVAPQQIPATPPPVEPLVARAIAPADARAINAAVPFSASPNPAAAPFRFLGNADDRQRALACLAAAQYYEAGEDPPGQRAVAQVVLNRLRHPAFPKSICAVVFQGSERATGCQFTFTCDGAMGRAPTPDGWRRAVAIAEAMLSGAVYRPVGHSTHYHTDWVVPYWSATLDKVAAVHSHLFFRWKGFWGTPSAFRLAYTGREPSIPQLAALSPAHAQTSSAPAALTPAMPQDAASLAAATPLFDPAANAATRTLPKGVHMVAASPAGDAFVIALPATLATESYMDVARTFCSGRARCRILGWLADAHPPTSFPIDPARLGAMRFSYIHDADSGLQRLLWNCAASPAPPGVTCMRERIPLTKVVVP